MLLTQKRVRSSPHRKKSSFFLGCFWTRASQLIKLIKHYKLCLRLLGLMASAVLVVHSSSHAGMKNWSSGAVAISRLVVPPWDVGVVLEGLKGPLFEPLDGVDLIHMSLKTVMLPWPRLSMSVTFMHSHACMDVSLVQSLLCAHMDWPKGFRRSDLVFVFWANPHREQGLLQGSACATN